MIVRFSRRSLLDLDEIEAWVAEDRPRAAIRLADGLMAASKALGRFPKRYPVIVGTPFRKRGYGPYLIVYRVQDEVEIVRVLHGARNWSLLLPPSD